MTEAKFTTTIKYGAGHDAPWTVVRSDDAAEHELDLQTLERNTTFATAGRVAAAAAAQYNVGKGLGAQGINAPVSTPAPAQPAYNGGTMAQPAQQAYAAPAQQAYASAPVAAPPGVPIILGQPAKLVDKGSWKAWADPRPASETGNDKLKTKDPNHPGLAAGTHKYWDFIR